MPVPIRDLGDTETLVVVLYGGSMGPGPEASTLAWIMENGTR